MITSIFANEAAGASLYGFYSRLIVEDVPRNGSGQPSPDLTALNLAILKVFKSLQLIDRGSPYDFEIANGLWNQTNN